MHIHNAINALTRYIDKNILPQMNGLQQVGYLTLIETLKADENILSEFFEKNIFARMLFATDSDGNINTDRLSAALRKAVSQKGTIEIEVPMYGKFTFKNDDINEIIRFISEEKQNETDTQSY